MSSNRNDLPASDPAVLEILQWIDRVDQGANPQIPPENQALRVRLPQDAEGLLTIGEGFYSAWKQRCGVRLDDAVVEDPSPSPGRETSIGRLGIFARALAAALQPAMHDRIAVDDRQTASAIAGLSSRLYRLLYPARLVDAEGLWLRLVAWQCDESGLEELVTLLVESPPHDWTATALALSPLMSHRNWPREVLFPRLFSALHHATTISAVLDLANHCQHRGWTATHPAKGVSLPPARASRESPATDVSSEASTPSIEDFLTDMLGGVVARLGMLEEDPTRFGDSAEKIQQILGDAVAICVSISDTLGLLEHRPAIGKLHQAMQLSHRRVQTEAAAALARMGEEAGTQTLLALAQEPVARLRVLTYADELGIFDRIDPRFAESTAIAEAELALWLSQPQQVGWPPQKMELIDHRELYWPSFEDPQPVFLFRFQYQLPQGEWSNIGIAGPLTHAFAADLADLPIVDIYAAFAGWQAEHPEIYEVPVANWNASQSRLAEKLAKEFEQRNHTEIRPRWLGFFLGEIALVADTHLDQTAGIGVTDGSETLWYPTAGRPRPVGAQEAYAIFKGRKLLRSFNDNLTSDLDAES